MMLRNIHTENTVNRTFEVMLCYMCCFFAGWQSKHRAIKHALPISFRSSAFRVPENQTNIVRGSRITQNFAITHRLRKAKCKHPPSSQLYFPFQPYSLKTENTVCKCMMVLLKTLRCKLLVNTSDLKSTVFHMIDSDLVVC